VRFVVRCLAGSLKLHATVQDTVYDDIHWTRQEYFGRWVATLHLNNATKPGTYRIALHGRCGLRPVRRSVRVEHGTIATTSVQVADVVVAHFMAQHDATSLRWNWGPAIFLYPLTVLANQSVHRTTYIDYVKRYHAHHLEKGLPDIGYADECPPALSSFELATSYQDNFAWPLVEQVMHWIVQKPRNRINCIDHVGDQRLGKLLYPSSIWVDSLVMWGLLTVKHAVATNQSELLAFGVDQPLLFYETLHDNATGLLHHAWDLERNQPLPIHNAPWLRGNGWALVAMANVLSLIGPSHEQDDALASNFVALSNAAVQYRQVSGFWDTVMAQPGYAYEESSGSALVAAAWAKGVRLGLLPLEFQTLAVDTFMAIAARLKRRGPGQYSMEEISIGTNPSGRLGYRLVPKLPNINYGVGSLLLLAHELADVDFSGAV
jgi:unsaturated rhamnogalacturonyl hydrolase